MDGDSGRSVGSDRIGAETVWPRRKWVRPAAVCLLVALVLVLYAPLLGADFVNYDDNQYVFQNKRVQAGLTWEGLRYYGTHIAGGLYSPLVWFSHMADCELFGLWPGGHHLTNVLIHATTVVLLLLFLARTTGAFWPSLLVAALFALHPVQVESVAWVAARKDVLSGLFFVLTLLAYASYVRRPGLGRYGAVLGCLLLGLMSKSMLVTVPFLLLLLDYWPLGRTPVPLAALPGRWPEPDGGLTPPKAWGVLVAEKLPLLAISLVFSYLSTLDQPIIDLERWPMRLRLLNTAVSYGQQAFNLFAPHGLAVYYPLDRLALTEWRAILFFAPLVLAVAAAVAAARRFPFLAVGSLWFVGLLAPVCGIVQIATAARADRYLYLPSIGAFIAIAWGLKALLPERPIWRKVALAGVAVWLIVLLSITVLQVRTWHNTTTLWTRAYAATVRSPRAARYMGYAMELEGRPADAVPYYQEALRLNPGFQEARKELAADLSLLGRWPEAARTFLQGLVRSPEDIEFRDGLVSACRHVEDPSVRERLLAAAGARRPQDQALHAEWARAVMESFEAALRSVSGLDEERRRESSALASAGKWEDAATLLLADLHIAPGDEKQSAAFRLACGHVENTRAKARILGEGAALRPADRTLQADWGKALVASGAHAEGLAIFEKIAAADPKDTSAQCSLAHALFGAGREQEAAAAYQRILDRAPHDPNAMSGLAWVLLTAEDQRLRDPQKALTMAQEALETGDPSELYYFIVFEAALRANTAGAKPAQ